MAGGLTEEFGPPAGGSLHHLCHGSAVRDIFPSRHGTVPVGIDPVIDGSVADEVTGLCHLFVGQGLVKAQDHRVGIFIVPGNARIVEGFFQVGGPHHVAGHAGMVFFYMAYNYMGGYEDHLRTYVDPHAGELFYIVSVVGRGIVGKEAVVPAGLPDLS